MVGLESGERLPMLCARETGVPLFEPTVWSSSELRARKPSVETAMKSARLLFVLWSAALISPGLAANDDGFHVKETILLGADLEAIQTAIPEMTQRGLDYRKYKITLVVDNGELIVIFVDPVLLPGTFGGTRDLPTYEVHLSADGKRVTDSHPSR
jgi:hypothetical protein